MKTLIGFGPKIQIRRGPARRPAAPRELLFSLFPPHAGMRQYWRDMDSLLEAWTRSEPHRDWWKNFLRDSGGTGFWHETYMMRGGMEAIYDDVAVPIGFSASLPSSQHVDRCSSATHRATNQPSAPPVVSESDLYAS